MGLCQPCINQISEVDAPAEHKTPPAKIRPLLADLEADFKEFSGDDGVLDAKELCEIWKKCAARKVGQLTAADIKLIESSSKDYFDQLDVVKDGKVSYEEFVTFMLGGSENRGALTTMRHNISASLKEDPKQLSSLIAKFKEWDKNGDGFVTPDEFEQHIAELEGMAAAASPQAARKAAASADEVRQIKEQLFLEADVDHDGRIDLWEAMAHALGRRKMPVEVLLYDISGGMADKMGKLLIGKKVAALHSGLLIYNSEYWYGGQVFRSEPPCSAAFGQPLKAPWDKPLPMSEQRPDLPVVQCGYTFVTHREFVKWMKDEVTHRYKDLAQYDLLTHSCHHFCNEAITFLTGEPLPDKIFELQRLAMTPVVMSLRPMLNKFLGGFGDAGKAVDANYFALDSSPDLTKADSQAKLVKEVLESGDVVLVEGLESTPVVATILKEVDGSVDIKYFESSTGTIETRSGIRASRIKRVQTDSGAQG